MLKNVILQDIQRLQLAKGRFVFLPSWGKKKNLFWVLGFEVHLLDLNQHGAEQSLYRLL